MKKTFPILVLALCLLAVPVQAGWKSGLLGGAVGYAVGSSGRDSSYREGYDKAKREVLESLRRIVVTSDKKKYTKEEVLTLLGE